ncbi:MAG TPA: response regulator, partial [Candidatus Thermoplasmatota archaeon]|nr:response regulator [Candidatus Thermoplasmatota archaeon]
PCMRRTHRILLLEDDADEADRSRGALVEGGYAVTLASSLGAARRVLRKERAFDLVIVDHHLPDGEGPQLIPHLRAAGVRAPVVMVTANRSDRVAEDAFRAGCADTAIKELNYHAWLPRMAEAFVSAADAQDASRWGAHVLGTCVGRVHGQSMQSTPAGLWPGYSGALLAATELALRTVRASGQSTLGSLPRVHVQARDDLHLLVAARGGVFAAALLNRHPTEEDWQGVFAAAAAFGRARAESQGAADP